MATYNDDPFSLPAAADLSANQYRFIVINSSAQAALAGAGADVDGVLQNKPDAAGKAASISYRAIEKVVAGAATTAAGPAASDSAGRAINAASTHAIVGRFLDAAGAAGQVVRVRMRPAARVV